MKHFLVTNDQYQPVFFDHPNGDLLCPILAATQSHTVHHFGAAISGMRAGPFTVVTQAVGVYLYAAFTSCRKVL